MVMKLMRCEGVAPFPGLGSWTELKRRRGAELPDCGCHVAGRLPLLPAHFPHHAGQKPQTINQSKALLKLLCIQLGMEPPTLGMAPSFTS